MARDLATRGAQLVLLTRQPLTDPFLVDFIMDLRALTGNELITAEQVDLSSLHSIRVFATKWVDNAPPRRLDMIILCANIMTPKGTQVRITEDGVESTFGINYLANFHLLSILSPALRAQPPDRDVRIIFGACSSYMGGQIPESVPLPKPTARVGSTRLKVIAADPAAAYGSSKLALMTFARAFQKHLSTYKRPDKQPMQSRVIIVDPGWSRTPGMRRYLNFGSLWGLAVYLIMWPFWWLVLKSPDQGGQTFLFAAMEAEFGRGDGGQFLKECKEAKIYRNEIDDEEAQKRLWGMSEKAIETLEKDGAKRRAVEKKAKEAKDNAANLGAATSEKQPGSRRSRKAA